MVVERGEIWRADLGEPRGSSPGFHRPVVIVQSDFFNQTRINTLVVAIITTNLRLGNMPGNVILSQRASGLDKESVINISQLFTVDRVDLLEFVNALSAKKMEQVDEGLRLILSLPKI
ncbi:MAG: type II toxin-antitoxin system PemK/MazF family toxin [Pyrinomonadaceae bacterium]